MKSPAGTKRVFIAEDSATMRARLIEMLLDMDGVSVVGEAETSAGAAVGILRTCPDYAVVDFQLRGGTGADVLRAIRAQLPGTFFIVITNYPEAQVLRNCREAGADAFLDKSSEIAKIREIIAGVRPDGLDAPIAR